VSCRSLTGGVGELTRAATLHESADGSHVHHAGCVAGGDLATLCEQGKKRHGHVVYSRDIGLKSVCPALLLGLPEVVCDGLRVGHLGLASSREFGPLPKSVIEHSRLRDALLVVPRNTSIVNQ